MVVERPQAKVGSEMNDKERLERLEVVIPELASIVNKYFTASSRYRSEIMGALKANERMTKVLTNEIISLDKRFNEHRFKKGRQYEYDQ